MRLAASVPISLKVLDRGQLAWDRRVVVPVRTPDVMEQLGFLRKTVESELARRAASRISPEAAEDLRGIDTALDTAIARGDVPAYLMLNYRFHSAIYAEADARVMADMAEGLWLRFGPSLRVVCGRFGTQNLPDRHKDLLAALSAGDPDSAAAAMVQDIEQGLDQIAAVLDRPA